MNIRQFCAASAGLAFAVLLSSCATSTTGSTPSNPEITWETTGTGGKKVKNVDLLFVQNAGGVAFANGVLTLRNVNPVTIAFSDRPERFAGHMPTSKFVPMWGSGSDSFLKDPPNATVSVLNGDRVTSLVVELRNPRLNGNDLSYDVEVLEGTPPDHTGPASLFIDVVGMPLTPASYAGAARRDIRTPNVGVGAPLPYHNGATVVHTSGTAVHYGPVAGPTAVHYSSTTVVRRR